MRMRFTRRGAQALSGTLGAAECHTGEGEAPEQVIPVAVRGEQPAWRGEPGLLQERRQSVQLIWEDWGVDHECLASRVVAGPRVVLHDAQELSGALGLLGRHGATDDYAVGMQNGA